MVNKQGKVIIPLEYDDVTTDASEGFLYAVKDYQLHYYTTDGKRAFVDKQFYAADNQLHPANRFSDGVAAVAELFHYDNENINLVRYAYIDTAGDFKTYHQFANPYSYSEGFVGETQGLMDIGSHSVYIVNFHDKSGKQVTSGLFIAPENPHNGYINPQGKVMIDYQFD